MEHSILSDLASIVLLSNPSPKDTGFLIRGVWKKSLPSNHPVNGLVPVKIEVPRGQSVFGRGVGSIRIPTRLYAGDLLTNKGGRRGV